MPLGRGSLSVLGSTLFSFLGLDMADHRTTTEVEFAALPLLNRERCEKAVRGLNLTPQQAKIAELVVLGKMDKEIATSLGLTRSTIRTHLQRIFTLLQVGNRMELALRVLAVICQHCKRQRKTRCRPKR
jgi:DNA-binding CsgD family transcriptional regulator